MKLLMSTVALVALALTLPTLASDLSFDRRSAEVQARGAPSTDPSSTARNVPETKKDPRVCDCGQKRERANPSRPEAGATHSGT